MKTPDFIVQRFQRAGSSISSKKVVGSVDESHLDNCTHMSTVYDAKWNKAVPLTGTNAACSSLGLCVADNRIVQALCPRQYAPLCCVFQALR